MDANLAVLAGDGIGPEVTAQAVKVLRAVGARFDHNFSFHQAPIGGVAINACGNPYPEPTHEICLKSDAVLFGAVGDPKYDGDPRAELRPEQGLLQMRKALGLYANVRPTFVFPSLIDRSPLQRARIEKADFIFVRELTGGIYFGEPRGRSENGSTAFDTAVYSKGEVERLARVGFELALKRRRKLTVVDKANVLATSRLWRETVQNMESEYPAVSVCYEFVDAVAMRLIQWPATYDVLITANLFGDILTDEASVITGSMGIMPSASLGDLVELFEPIHGSYPQAAGRDIANPLASILSAAMLLEMAFGLKAEALAVRQAVEKSLDAGVLTADLAVGKAPWGTAAVGDWIAREVHSLDVPLQ